MVFRGIELDFDIYDADTAEDYEAELKKVQEMAAEKVDDETLSAGIRRQCQIVFDFFDNLFGSGFHRDLFSGKTNLRECLSAFKEFTDAVNAQRRSMEALTSAATEQTIPNRATRRAAERRKPPATPGKA